MAIKIRTVIVEDIPFHRNKLVEYLHKYALAKDIEFVSVLPDWGVLDKVEVAIQQITDNWTGIDLIFLDSGIISIKDMGYRADAGIDLLKDLWRFAQTGDKKNKTIPFRVIVFTSQKDIGTQFMQLPIEIRNIVEGYVQKDKDDELQTSIDAFISKFFEDKQPAIELQLTANRTCIINARQYDGYSERQFIFDPDDIIYVKGDGNYHRYYLCKKRRDQLEEYLLEEALVEQLQTNEQYKKLTALASEIRKRKDLMSEMEAFDAEVELNQIKISLSEIKAALEPRYKVTGDTRTLITTGYMRFAGGIGVFKKLMEQKRLTQFRDINGSYLINLNYLSSYFTAKRGRCYELLDGTELHQVP